jgi:hypothetical protein
MAPTEVSPTLSPTKDERRRYAAADCQEQETRDPRDGPVQSPLLDPVKKLHLENRTASTRTARRSATANRARGPPPTEPRNEQVPASRAPYIGKRKTALRYDTTPRTIDRWSEDPDLGFPERIIINGRVYFSEPELDAFDRRCAANVVARPTQGVVGQRRKSLCP